jgi:hypothetical protein
VDDGSRRRVSAAIRITPLGSGTAAVTNQGRTGETQRAAGSGDAAVPLNYIDKLHAAFQHVQATTMQMSRFAIVMSALLLALVTGLVTTDESIEISGIKLSLPIWTLVGGAAVAIGIASVFAAVMAQQGALLISEIVSLYDAQGYDIPDRNEQRGTGIKTSIAYVLGYDAPPEWSGTRRAVKTAIVYGTGGSLVLLPIAAQMAAMIALGGDFGWTWRVVVPLGGVLALHIAALIWVRTRPAG